MNAIAEFFRQNGTKIIGYVTIAAGFIAVADPALVSSLLGPNATRWALLVSGLLTAIRGHTNTAAIKDEIRVEEKAKEEIKVEKAVDRMSQTPPEMPPKEAP
jgi:hypothetical protein